jgi:hypothetical protein
MGIILDIFYFPSMYKTNIYLFTDSLKMNGDT